MTKRVWLCLCLMVVSAICSGDELSISDNEILSYKLPEGFRFKIAQDPDDQFRPSLKYSHYGKNGFKDFGFKIFLYKIKQDEVNDLKTDQQKSDFLAVDCKGYEKGSVEKKTTIKKYVGHAGVFYCSYTDASLAGMADIPLGQFKNVTVALAIRNNFEFLAVAYSNSVKDELFGDFMQTMDSLKVVNKQAGTGK